MRKPVIIIPRAPLGQDLDEATTIQREMTELLRQLETSAAAPAGWRHQPPAN